MKLSQHPDPASLLSYSSGGLSTPFTLLLSMHISLCSKCSEMVRLYNEVGGVLIEDIADISLSQEALSKFMDSIENENNDELTISRVNADFKQENEKIGIPFPLYKYIGSSLEKIKWRYLAPGIKRFTILIEGEKDAYLSLLHIAPGKKIPQHTHTGEEMTFVVSGSFEDKTGAYSIGDIAHHDQKIEHQPSVSGKQPCVCIIATEGPMIFKSFFANLFISFYRI
jgi:putative transcriptional regulator